MANSIIIKIRFFVIAGIVTTSLLISCQSEPKSEQIKNIELCEKSLYEAQEIDRNKGIQLIETYISFSKKYPDDTLSAVYLYRAGEIAMNFKLGNQSIAYFDNVIANFPAFSKVPECLFLKAFVYDDQLKDFKNAGKYYNEFITKYPDHPLVKDAKASLEYLGKSPEELVKMFQENNKAE